LKRFLIRTLITAGAIFIVVNILPWAEVENPISLIITAILLGLLNAVLRPLLIFLTLPITVLSFGLFVFIINGLILYLVAALVPGFRLENFGVAVLAAFLISLISWAINWLIHDTVN
jgi:putative membrane protein